jgi:hypothetical protein
LRSSKVEQLKSLKAEEPDSQRDEFGRVEKVEGFGF